MKMSTQLFDTLKSKIEDHDNDERRRAYKSGDIVGADKVKDMDVRYRWDLYWDAWRGSETIRDLVSDEDLHTPHIDTALRQIVSPL